VLTRILKPISELQGMKQELEAMIPLVTIAPW
jgi:hypothetical protein